MGIDDNWKRRKLRPVSDGIDFLGYIVRPDYLLVRRRMVGALRERLLQAEEALRRAGMRAHENGRAVFPWPWGLLEKIHQWLNSYLAHFSKGSSYRLTLRLRERFDWLDEYFKWVGAKVVFRRQSPRGALRFSQQKIWFINRLPGHVIMVQLGGFWEMICAPSGTGGKKALAGPANVPALPRRFPDRRLSYVKSILWQSGHRVAWIKETGRRLCSIAERALACRWGLGICAKKTDKGICASVC